jgi:phosphatidylserine decarboxylase
MSLPPHQYIDRETSAVRTEQLLGDRLLHRVYGAVPEDPHALLKLLTSRWATRLLGYLNYDLRLGPGAGRRLARSLGIDLGECVEPPRSFDTPRKVFERQIRYWEVRPLAGDPDAIASPADARVLLGSLATTSSVSLKGKFFAFEELVGPHKPRWLTAFRNGDFAVFRLTPDKYHYNHVPASGIVCDVYELPGAYHSCNPGPVVSLVVPYSKNRRVVTVIDTDVPGGTRAGLVAMVEVVALMVGAVEQRYSEARYEAPRPVVPGMFLRKGQPKSLYRPGSSTDVLLFQRGRVTFSEDLVLNMTRGDVQSRFSLGFGRSLVETDVKARSTVARAVRGYGARRAPKEAPHGQ